MNFSEFAQLLYPYKGKGCTEPDFVIYLISQVIKTPISKNDEKQEEWNGTPFDNFENDTLIRIFNNTRQISKRIASKILSCLDKKKFETFIADSSDEAKKYIGNGLREKGIHLSDEDVPSTCANIFVSILDDCANRKRASRQTTLSDNQTAKHQIRTRCDSEEDVFNFFNQAIFDYQIKKFVEVVDPTNIMDIDYVEKCEGFVLVIREDSWIPCRAKAIKDTRELVRKVYLFAEILDDYTSYLGHNMRPLDQAKAPTRMVPLYRDENVPWALNFEKTVIEYRQKLVSIYLDICSKMFPEQDDTPIEQYK